MVEDEALLIIERQNAKIATEAAIMQLVVGSILDKKTGKLLEKRLKKLSIEVGPRSIAATSDAIQWPPPNYIPSSNGWEPPEVEE